MELEIVYVDIESVVPYAMNSNTHSEKQLREIAESIKQFGFIDPIALDGEKILIEGHGRVLAAKMVGMIRVPAIFLTHLTEDEKRAYIMAHNKIARNSVFDMEKVAQEMETLLTHNFDLAVVGFDEKEIEEILREADALFPEEPLFSKDTEPEKKTRIGKKKEASKIVHKCPNCNHQFSA